jgi:hypothetical protein
VRFQVLMAASMNITAFFDIASCRRIIALMMEAVRTSETSVNFYETTWCNILEGCHLHSLLRSLNFIKTLNTITDDLNLPKE